MKIIFKDYNSINKLSFYMSIILDKIQYLILNDVKNYGFSITIRTKVYIVEMLINDSKDLEIGVILE